MTEAPGHAPVVEILLCGTCRTRYVMTPEEVLNLQRVADTATWITTAIGYAVAAGWHRSRGARQCSAHDSPSAPAAAGRG